MRKTIKNLLAWGERKHYPFLNLSETDNLRHGEAAWKQMAKDRKRRALAWRRIELWQECLRRAS